MSNAPYLFSLCLLIVTQAFVGGIQSSLLDGTPSLCVRQLLGSEGRYTGCFILVIFDIEGIGASRLRYIGSSSALVLQKQVVIHVIEFVIEMIVHWLQVVMGHLTQEQMEHQK